MKISINRLKKYIALTESPEEIGALLTQSGLEVEGIEAYESIKGGLAGIVIGEVLTCEKHPDADKLKLTTVDIGQLEPSQIVCGAPNVAKGQKVLVATIGATLYPTEGDSFQIKKAKIRGQASEGMICAEDELGLGKSHAGIMVLDTGLPNGTPASKLIEVGLDHILEIGLTPN
ncbi:MAG: phenylalanyl-tRNA synthetase beta chain, partial [Algoriphagus sp.]